VKLTRITAIIMAGVVFVIIGVLVGALANVLPIRASAESISVDTLFNVMLAIATIIFLIVECGLIYAIVRFRRKPGDESDGLPMHGSTALEITWTAIPAVIVFVLSLYSYQVFADQMTPTGDEMGIGVVGQQFQWKFVYDMPAEVDPNLTGEVRESIASYMTSTELVIPVNQAVRMDISATDVMHAFFVPEFRIKQDAIPGRITTAYFTPTETGEWWVLCAELCGAGHAQMSQVNRVRVVERAEFDQYVMDLYTAARNTATDPTSAGAGRQLLASGVYPCGGCHIITDIGANGNQGPSLNGIATRAAGHAERGEGVLGGNDARAYIRTSIVNPNYYVVPGWPANVMPQVYGDPGVMPPDHLEAIVNYLMTLEEAPQ
jgi:cytochrome c oxidase subunit II